MSKLALSFSLIIVGVLLVGSIVSASLRYSNKCGNNPDPSPSPSSMTNFSRLNNPSPTSMSNLARFNDRASSNNLVSSLNNEASSSPYISSVDNANNYDWSYGDFRGGDNISGCAGCAGC